MFIFLERERRDQYNHGEANLLSLWVARALYLDERYGASLEQFLNWSSTGTQYNEENLPYMIEGWHQEKNSPVAKFHRGTRSFTLRFILLPSKIHLIINHIKPVSILKQMDMIPCGANSSFYSYLVIEEAAIQLW